MLYLNKWWGIFNNQITLDRAPVSSALLTTPPAEPQLPPAGEAKHYGSLLELFQYVCTAGTECFFGAF